MKLFENVSLIIPESLINSTNNIKGGALWLGNYKAALDSQFIIDNNISVIVNCSVDIPYIYDIKELNINDLSISKLETFRIPVNDSLLDHDIYIMEQYYHTVIPFIIKKLLNEHKNVLVHCHAGAQRSASVVAAVLYVLIDNKIMSFNEIDSNLSKEKLMKSIFEYILSKRPRAFSYGLRVNFKKSLEMFFNIKLN